MYKILVVEDNLRINNHLEHLLKKSMGTDMEIYAALDGEKAKEMIDDRNINLLITDIRMPKVSGLELISYARQKKSDIKVIIISAYEDFKVAQEAIALKVDRFLLKPFDGNKLIALVNEIYEAYLYEETGYINTIIHQKLLGKKNLSPSINFAYYLLYLRIGAFGSKQKLNIEEQLHNVLKQQRLSFDYYIQNVNRETFCIVIYHKDVEKEMLLQGVAYYLFKVFSEKYEMVNLYLSEKNLNIKDLHEIHTRCYQNLTFSLVMGNSQVFQEKDEKPSFDLIHLEKEFGSFKRQIESCIVSKNRQELAACLKQYFSQKEFPVVFVKRLVVGIFEKIIETSNNLFDENLLEIIDTNLKDCNNMEDVLQMILILYDRLEKNNTQSENASVQDIAQQILAYLKNKVYENITLKDLANYYHFSESYIVRIINQQTGKTPMKWAVMFKIEEAKNLIKANPNLKIIYLSEKLGFSDQRYFCKVFKNYTGYTVSEYKTWLMNHEDRGETNNE